MRTETLALFSSASGSFLVALPALFSIVNPIAGALIYNNVTAHRPHNDRVRLAWRVAFYSAMVMLCALWIGATVMSFFGVSIDALRIAGGLVVAASAWEMLLSNEQTEGRKQQQAAPAAASDDVAFFPLTMPFTTGPGTISVAIALSASRPNAGLTEVLPFFAGVSAAALVVALLVGVFYASADRVVNLLGTERARVLTRLAAFLLLCIGVQILLVGVQGVLTGTNLTPK